MRSTRLLPTAPWSTRSQSLTKKDVTMWVLAGLIVVGTAFNSYLLDHIEDQIDELQEGADR